MAARSFISVFGCLLWVGATESMSTCPNLAEDADEIAFLQKAIEVQQTRPARQKQAAAFYEASIKKAVESLQGQMAELRADNKLLESQISAARIHAQNIKLEEELSAAKVLTEQQGKLAQLLVDKQRLMSKLAAVQAGVFDDTLLKADPVLASTFTPPSAAIPLDNMDALHWHPMHSTTAAAPVQAGSSSGSLARLYSRQSAQEVQQSGGETTFSKLDQNGDGVLSEDDLSLLSVHPKVAGQAWSGFLVGAIRYYLKFADADGNGHISQAEYARANASDIPAPSATTLESWFEQADTNRDGRLSKIEAAANQPRDSPLPFATMLFMDKPDAMLTKLDVVQQVHDRVGGKHLPELIAKMMDSLGAPKAMRLARSIVAADPQQHTWLQQQQLMQQPQLQMQQSQLQMQSWPLQPLLPAQLPASPGLVGNM
eukprot:gnl/TRDRNA2_/TRDRNA2_112689_c0_seq1.p1 gnl/TRDRNA2_/TRDRNA2_112689_c0~~gnl/TRDRNA2_/TRDRNA2_112689_c0_seq1.p1  ORF type:complete len:428 (+),score=112.37 gnl/TRDRNA2_/TRDRNA2_112689_c0_seq1:137-1420(+)